MSPLLGGERPHVLVCVLCLVPDRLISAGLRAALDLLLRRDARDLPRFVAEATRLVPTRLVDDVMALIRTEAGHRLSTALGSVVFQLPESIQGAVLDELLSQPGAASRRAILTKTCSTWRDPLDAGQRAILRRCLDSPSLDTTLCVLAAPLATPGTGSGSARPGTRYLYRYPTLVVDDRGGRC